MIDFHCHLDLFPNPHEVTRACVERELYVLSVTTTPSAWKGTSALAVGAPRIRTALGLHPQVAHMRKRELELFEQLLPDVRYVGEIGLDATPDFKSHFEDQVEVFARILDLCRAAGGRVLSIHSRRATSTVLDMIASRRDAGTAVLHWFSGTLRELARASAEECWFSVGPAMLATEKGRALTARMPRERVLTESDGPFAQIEGRSALPSDVDLAVDRLVEVWHMTRAEVEELLRANLRRLASAHVQDTP